jgi:hypothetical protein
MRHQNVDDLLRVPADGARSTAETRGERTALVRRAALVLLGTLAGSGLLALALGGAGGR